MRVRCRVDCMMSITISVLGVLLVVISSASAQSNDECASCHDEVSSAFSRSPHGRAFAADRDLVGADCRSCHGDGAAHVEAGGGRGSIENPALGDAEHANAGCLSCHQNQVTQAMWQGSAHEAAGIKCASCHAVHDVSEAGRKVAGRGGTTDLCLECHVSYRKGLSQRSTHPLREGLMECSSCHNPHGGTNEHLIDADSVNDLCLSCHQEKRGPFLWEHSPVREDCLTCHAPHGSNHPGLLVARTVQVCQSCHLQGRHQTVAGTATAMWNVNRQCLNCHPAIHGSNHPSGPLFQR